MMVEDQKKFVQPIKGNLLTRAREEGTPLIEGNTAIFVWEGKKPPLLFGDFHDWEEGESITLKRVSSRVWAATLQLPHDAYVEYAFRQGEEQTLDPFNPRITPNGMGDSNNFFYMPGGSPTSLRNRKRGVQAGKVSKHLLEDENFIAGGKRNVYLYQPAVQGPYPLLIVFDGVEYRQYAHLPQILDNLIAQQRIRPAAVAMVENGGQSRFIEYACSESTLGFLVHHVLPLADRQLDLVDIERNPGAYTIMGASMGGLMALYSALRLPHLFGSVLSQSGAFSYDGFEFIVFDLISHLDRAVPLKVWMDVGKMEWLLLSNRKIRVMLCEKGCHVSYHEYSGGHNYVAWRDDLWRGLEFLYPVENDLSQKD